MEMTDAYQEAIKGTLRSPWWDQPEGTLLITNDTPIPVDVYWVGYDGDLYGINKRTGLYEAGHPGTRLYPGGKVVLSALVEMYWLIKSSYSGAFVAVVQERFSTSGSYTVTGKDLLDPNGIGEIPFPTRDVVIPPDGARILVGAGRIPVYGARVIREQFWKRMPDSYSLAPGESRTVSYTITSGIEDSSSDSETVNDSVGASASVGWGPFSASVSASLSQSSSTTQQVTVSTQTSSSVSTTYDNVKGVAPVMLLFWQLTDVLTVFDANGKPLSSVISGKQPPVVSGPFDVDELRKPPETPDVASLTRARTPRLASVARPAPPIRSL
ncbi:hypothetical protein ACFRJ7_24835 [Streptomyces sp. NPDC056747]|uniref:hypothetical protein n=1 Tax=Streptomyces sp. NPDC056747 TaxID=3345935 RepID=UPI0036AFE2B0